jgi:hypothetical protein
LPKRPVKEKHTIFKHIQPPKSRQSVGFLHSPPTSGGAGGASGARRGLGLVPGALAGVVTPRVNGGEV